MNTRTITIDLDKMEPEVISRLNMDFKENEQGFIEIDEVDNISIIKKERVKSKDVKLTFNETYKLVDLIEKKALVLAVKYQDNTSGLDMEITLSNDRGYTCVEFCGGVYEVSIRTDIREGLYEASVGDELVMFDSLDDAVSSFFKCIENAIEQILEKEGRDY